MNTTTLPAPAPTTPLVLSPGQDAALTAYIGFLMNPLERTFVLSGYSGTGKSTLVATMIDRLPEIIETCKLINADLANYQVQLTATTNKAAENFAYVTKRPCDTIQSFLGLRVHTNYDTGETKLIPGNRMTVKSKYILFIDEYSYVDPQLLKYIFQYTEDCKIIFIGDPAQLLAVNCNFSPVSQLKANGAELRDIMRQSEGNPIAELGAKFRQMVTTGERFQFTPDGHHVQWMEPEQFEQQLLTEFNRPDWTYHDSKVLAWTNKRGIQFNHWIRDAVKGSPAFHPGDYAVCNSYVPGNGRDRSRLKTDQMVLIKDISGPMTSYGVRGRNFTLDQGTYFGPDSLDEWAKQVKALQNEGEYTALQAIEQSFVDLRAVYSCTVNKSQGSTFDKVFIDLNDVGKCRNQDNLARMLYVAVTRARSHVYLVGDLT